MSRLPTILCAITVACAAACTTTANLRHPLVRERQPHALVYFFRGARTLLKEGARVEISVAGQPLLSLYSEEYTVIPLVPGVHEVEVDVARAPWKQPLYCMAGAPTYVLVKPRAKQPTRPPPKLTPEQQAAVAGKVFLGGRSLVPRPHSRYELELLDYDQAEKLSRDYEPVGLAKTYPMRDPLTVTPQERPNNRTLMPQRTTNSPAEQTESKAPQADAAEDGGL